MRIVMISVMLVIWLAAPCWADNGFKEGDREVGTLENGLGTREKRPEIPSEKWAKTSGSFSPRIGRTTIRLRTEN